MKLKSSIPSNSVKLIDLYNKIISGSLITGPDYQRKLVWKKQHKYSFIETILLNFPFPEIYIASAEVDLSELKAREVVVDGQQRLTTIVDYIQGNNDFELPCRIKSFDELSPDDKREFLNYLITVKDLKDIGDANIIEVFKRINSTNYALNSNEVLNAQFGGGEFAIFCKLLADRNFTSTETDTEIIISAEDRELIVSFFERNKVFSENDIKRMFDSQYLMLITSTLLDGAYFGRSTKINHYLEKYNEEFSIYKNILYKIINSLTILNQLCFSPNSYWYNKANLFTLIIELSKFKNENIGLEMLELKLLDLESKVDIYFNGDENEVKDLSTDETKYFEEARQGSHELQAREHRGSVIRSIIQSSLKDGNTILLPDLINKNTAYLKTKGVDYAILIPTQTGLSKSIMDATLSIREFFKDKNIHDYESQAYGPLSKVKIRGYFVLNDFTEREVEVSLYRSNGRGDYRIWFSTLSEFAQPNDNLAILHDTHIKILNLSKHDYTTLKL